MLVDGVTYIHTIAMYARLEEFNECHVSSNLYVDYFKFVTEVINLRRGRV